MSERAATTAAVAIPVLGADYNWAYGEDVIVTVQRPGNLWNRNLRIGQRVIVEDHSWPDEDLRFYGVVKSTRPCGGNPEATFTEVRIDWNAYAPGDGS